MAQAAKKVRVDPKKQKAARSFSPAQAFERAGLDTGPAGDPAKKPRKIDMLDRSKDFGEVQPPGSFHGAFYAQDFKYYDQDGFRIKFNGEEDLVRQEQEGRNRKSRFDRASNLDAPPRDSFTAEPTDTSIPEVEPGDVHLTAWGLGEVDYRFPQVRDAIRDRFGKLCMDIRSACQTLRDEGVIAANEGRDLRR